MVCVCMWCVVYAQLPEQQTEEQKEELLLTRSDLWRTLFRGGYMAGKKLIRSLSGAHVSSPSLTLSDCDHASSIPDGQSG